LQSGLPELIQQTTKALDEGQPELAHTIWKQVVQNCQTISHLFNQTTGIMTGAPQRSRQNGRGQYANGNRGQGQQRFATPSPKQLSKIVRQVTESVLATA
jgi:hypothetical protein